MREREELVRRLMAELSRVPTSQNRKKKYSTKDEKQEDVYGCLCSVINKNLEERN